MRALKYILYILLGLVVLIGALGLFAKSSYHIERSIEIDAPKNLVYDQVLFFKNFHEWSPWSHLDPNMKLSYEGTEGTAGASYSWSGNDDVGEGKLTLKAASPEQLGLQLDFVRPFKSSIPVVYKITGNEEKTKVTWGFDPHFPFPINVWAMFTDIDKAMGGDYERGLSYLKRRCESMAHKKYHGYEVAEQDLSAINYLSLRKVVPIAEITAYFAENLPKIMSVSAAEKLSPAGPISGLYWTFDQKSGMTDMAVALPVKEDQKAPKDFEMVKIGAAKALVIDYLGDYSKMGDAHTAMDEYMAGNKLRNVPPVIETYVTDGANEPDTAKWLTKIIYYVEPMPDSTNLKK